MSVKEITCEGRFASADAARAAARVLLNDANAFEAAEAEAKGLRVFDCPWGKHTYTHDGLWWIGEQTEHSRNDHVHMFANPVDGERGMKASIHVGSSWTGDPDLAGEFSHVIVAKARWVASIDVDGVSHERYIEVAA